MKPIVTKAHIRQELENQIQEFLSDGGAVKNIPRGESGHLSNQNLFKNQGGSPPPQPRTPVDELVKTLEERKHSGPVKTDSPNKKNKKGPQKKLITDDFGEPLRWVWVDE